jgi:hypothetical protein
MSDKPSYGLSRLYVWWSFIGAWTVIFLLAIGALMKSDQAVAFGATALPAMAGIIVGVLAAHRGFGSMDFWAQRKHIPSPQSPAGYFPRDEPTPSPMGDLP